jgi:hypothetical protein
VQTKLQAGRISADVGAKLAVLGGQFAAYDFRGAQRTQTELANLDWNETKEWLKGVRQLVTLAVVKSGGGR